MFDLKFNDPVNDPKLSVKGIFRVLINEYIQRLFKCGFNFHTKKQMLTT